LGQLSMDAATQRFVAEDQARIERYNRLEDGAYQVLAQHLAEVLAAQQQAERESFAAALGSTERGHVEQGRRLAAEAEFLMRDVQNVAVDAQRILNALAVDERALGAAPVLNAVFFAIVRANLGVLLGHAPREDDEIRLFVAADPEGKAVQRNPLGRAAGFGEVFQIWEHVAALWLGISGPVSQIP